MDVLSTLMLGGLVTLITQIMKKFFPDVNPLYWVAALAMLGGLLYGIVLPLFPAEVAEKMAYSFTAAIAFYEVLKNFVNK